MRASPLLLAAVLLAGCGSVDAPAAAPSLTAERTLDVTVGPTTPAATTPPTTPSPTAKSPTAKPRSVTPRSVAPTPSTTPAVRRTASAASCPGLSGDGGSQVVLVVGSGSSASIRACERRNGRWVSVLGTMRGHVGKRGVAPAGAKREGDLRTPSGTYPLGRGFGQRANPGVRFSWRVVDSQDVWVDDSASSLYNSWQRKPAKGRWSSAEDLDISSYAYAQVIDYNTARVPGKGSAIFFHVDHGSGTAGCVSLPTTSLLKVLRWERAGARIVIR